MILYTNINLSLLTEKDLSNFIIRKYNNNYIIGLVTESSGLLHKKKRFRPGGLFCEEIFGLLRLCSNKYCNLSVKFNFRQILNKLCSNCNKFMKLNFKRKYRFGFIFLNFPIINYYYFKDFINLLKVFDKIKKEYFFKNNSIKLNKFNTINNIFLNSVILENKFLNFINSFYKITRFIELLKLKLNFITKKKSIKTVKFDKFNKYLNNLLILKKLFLTMFPILPTGLRPYSMEKKKYSINSNLNCLYKGLIDLNNSIKISYKSLDYNLKHILALHIFVEIILNFYKPFNSFGQMNEIHDKLQGKYGIFRQNLLGFRVDYSGRAVIIPGPYISLNNIGLPFNIINSYITCKTKFNYYSFYESSLYKQTIIEKIPFLFYSLPSYSVIINRAPTLHKMNIQSFNPVLVEGESIKFMPLLCSGYNADFDGDQVGVFSINKKSSEMESFYMVRSLVNMHSSTTKHNIFDLTQGMLSGYYILSNYNYLQFMYSYVAVNYVDLLETMCKTILINSPILLRSLNKFYLTTFGRFLCKFFK